MVSGSHQLVVTTAREDVDADVLGSSYRLPTWLTEN